jgi:hypothetical protein
MDPGIQEEETMLTRKAAEARVKGVTERARRSSRVARERILTATDATLAKAGRAAERRQRRRALKSALRVAGKAAIVACAAAASVVATRAAVRARKNRRAEKA